MESLLDSIAEGKKQPRRQESHSHRMQHEQKCMFLFGLKCVRRVRQFIRTSKFPEQVVQIIRLFDPSSSRIA
jgi:hypothetical protein